MCSASIQGQEYHWQGSLRHHRRERCRCSPQNCSAQVPSLQQEGHGKDCHVLDNVIIHLHSFIVQVGVCGEHGGDPSSIAFFDRLGLDYVSCSPYRVPTAKIAAAQAHIKASMSEFTSLNVEYIWCIYCSTVLGFSDMSDDLLDRLALGLF